MKVKFAERINQRYGSKAGTLSLSQFINGRADGPIGNGTLMETLSNRIRNWSFLFLQKIPVPTSDLRFKHTSALRAPRAS